MLYPCRRLGDEPRGAAPRPQRAPTPPDMEIKWNKVAEDLSMQLKEEAHEFVESTEGDLGGWAAEIAADAVEAASLGRTDLLPHLKAQMRTLAGSKQVEIREAGWRVMDTAISMAFKMATSMLNAAVV
jgi:hypothetical protein